MEQLRQLRLLLWKNLVFQIRRPLRTLVELLLPVLIACVLIGIRQTVKAHSHPNATEYPSFSLSSLPPSIMATHMLQLPQFEADGWFVAFVPCNVSAVIQLAAAVEDQLTPNITAIRFDVEEELLEFISQGNKSAQNILAAVVIDHNFQRWDDPLPSQFHYRLRFRSSQSMANRTSAIEWNTDLMYPEFESTSPREADDMYGGFPGYYAEGFLTLQHVIDQAVIKTLSGQSGMLSSMSILLQRFPYPEYLDDPFIFTIQTQIPILVMLSFIFVIGSIVGSIVLEKERKQKEYMKMMGLCNWLHWTAWFLHFFLFTTISVLLVTILFCVKTGVNGAVLNHSDPTLIFVFLLFFMVATISFSFMLSTFFNRASLAAKVGVFIYFMSYIPYFFIATTYKFMTVSEKLASCLLSNVAMALGAQVIGMFEGKGTGVQWNSLVEPVSIDDNFTMGHVLLMLIVDSIIYGLLTWYIEAVRPGEFGIPQPWYFFILPSYWGCTQNTKHNQVVDLEQLNKTSACEYIEFDPKGLDAGICIKNLHKVFTSRGKKRVAVQFLNLKMYEGHITVLLGHNGAGKSTTLSLLTGLFPPTSGTAIVSGFDIVTDMPLVRRNLGLCPQHDILFDFLTTYEHLHFFAKLKGLSDQKAKEEAYSLLKMFQLTHKEDTNAGMLSGGMKRKLSIGIALIGGSKVLMLDEPTSGMDPVARRSVWDILLEQRHGRTILLTTHFMEEADILGDRVAIMAAGHLQCSGSPLFLKSRYGVGYRLVLVKTPGCQEHAVERLVRRHVPSAQINDQAGAELSFLLPKEESKNFAGLFGEMEMRRNELGIAGYGASVTTMEEVFLKVCDTAGVTNELMPEDKDLPENSAAKEFQDRPSNVQDIPACPKNSCNTGVSLWAQQFVVLMRKRLLYTPRHWLVLVAQVAVPLVFTLMSLLVIELMPRNNQQPALNMTLERYGSNMVSYAVDSLGSGFAQTLSQEFAAQFHNSSTTAFDINTEANFTANMIDYLKSEAKKQGGSFNHKYLVAAVFHDDATNHTECTALFNNQAYHTPATALLLLENAILRLLAGPGFSLTVTNHPLPPSDSANLDEEFQMGSNGFAIAFNLMYGLATLASSFSLLLVAERTSKAKHLQFVSGASPLAYWLSALLCDFLTFLLTSCLILILFVAFQMEGYTHGTNMAVLFFILVLYGWSIIPLMYLLSNIFTEPSMAFVGLSIINILTGTATFLIVFILSSVDLDLKHTASILDWIFLLLPNYSVGQAVNNIYQNYKFLEICTQNIDTELYCKMQGFVYQRSYIAWGAYGVGRYLTFMAAEGLIFCIIVIFFEYNSPSHYVSTISRILRNLFNSTTEKPEDHRREEAIEEVEKERDRILNTSFSQLPDCLVLRDLYKVYPGDPPVVAVAGLSLGISGGECFGLLGFNGAGKTTTFKMLTGDVKPSAGDAFLQGYSIHSDWKQARHMIGYCPQFDALFDHMTARETLYFYAGLRGLGKQDAFEQVEGALHDLLLIPHANKLVHTYRFLQGARGVPPGESPDSLLTSTLYSRLWNQLPQSLQSHSSSPELQDKLFTTYPHSHDLFYPINQFYIFFATSFSGGTKRKLSTAVALIGHPPVVVLDEPSTGMDPIARHRLWNVLGLARLSGQAVVLTSHSMEECEALCTRLAIMVNGRFQCLGSTQQLKNTYGSGYTLLTKLRSAVAVHDLPEDDADAQHARFKAFIKSIFPGSCIKDEHQCLLHYHLDSSGVTWAEVFGIMEKAKEDFALEDYSVSQITLEQVFLSFAQFQHDQS
uniref:phospholipid-transporting ATPase ABCA3-like isoform X2 n=1 Tax=Myxine glutinosa TaxID=7769 RepID=UPI00358EF626